MTLVVLHAAACSGVVRIVIESLVELAVSAVIITQINVTLCRLESEGHPAHTLKMRGSQRGGIVIRVIESLEKPLCIDVVGVDTRLEHFFDKGDGLGVTALFGPLSGKKNARP